MCDERQIASEFESTAICTLDIDDTEGSADAVLAEFFLGHERGCRSTSSNRPSSSLSLPLFHSNGLFDQTPIRCDGAHIGQTFSARGSDFPSRVCVPTCLAIRPVGGRLSSLPPSILLPPCSPSESSPRPTATSCITAGTAASRAGRLHAAGEEALTPSTMRVGVQRALWASHAVSLSPSPEQ